MKKALSYFFAIIMLLSAIGHVASPETYAPLMPDFLPETLTHILTSIAEAATGILLLMPKTRSKGGLAFALLMIAFLPVHVWDVTRVEPAMGSVGVAGFRLVMQFVLIYGGWFIYKRS
jgi:uncharacterized membrane protein